MNKTIQATSSTSSFHLNGPEMGFYTKSIKSKEKPKKPKSSFEASLPFISPFYDGAKNIKVNQIRKQSEDTEEQIILMKARLNALKEMKQKIEAKKQKSLQRIQFIHTVRQRKNFESMQKLIQKQKQNKELDELKQKAKEFREGMRRQIQRARETLYLKNLSRAYEKKEEQMGNEGQIVKKQQKWYEERIIKVQKIKQQEQKHAQILRQFQQSRIKQSKKNHTSRVKKQLKQKESRQKSLEKLRQQHQKFIEQVKVAEKQYDETIQKLNPETLVLRKGSRISLFEKMGLEQSRRRL